jgi:hypothetical protein
METVAFLGLLGLGYAANSVFGKKSEEGFTDSTVTRTNERSPPGARTVPGTPRAPQGGYDTMFQLPAGGMLPSEPYPSKMQAGPQLLPVSPISLPTQRSVIPNGLQTRPDRWEDATTRPAFISPLSGVEYKSGDFKHNNMVPFFRGQVKQSMIEGANSQVLDAYNGSGKTLYAKREQTPFFEPTKEPMGNPYGMESTTDFVEGRIVEPRNRSGERPVEPIRVGPGLNQGFTHIPSGGYQQQAGEEYVINRMPRTDDIRVATNPKLTYSAPVVQGSHYITTSGTAESVGEVRKYTPDTFYINENGERNFVTVGADTKPAVRSTQVIKHTTRPDTSKSYSGNAGQAEGKATYTVGSTRTPLAKQHGSWGFRNADATNNFNADTDLPQNDYGKGGVEILPNERYYTGERVHATNMAPDGREVALPLQDGARPTRAEETIQNPRSAGNFNAMGGGMPAKLKVYDPNDTARTTIKETTIDNDWLGIAGIGDAQPKLTVYDPNDVARTTIKETTIDNDWLGMAAPSSAQPKLTVYDPNDTARTTIKETTIDNDWLGMAAPSSAQPKLTVYDPNDTARTTIRETTEDNDYMGVMAPADVAQKLTVYDPDDIARVTGRNTLADWDTYRNMGRQDLPSNPTTRVQDGVRLTQKAAISGKSAYTGSAGAAFAKAEINRQNAVAMRHYAQKENIARGRVPTASATKVFNGEDYVNLQYRRIVADSVNDRAPGSDRVSAAPASVEVLGAQRPRTVLKLDVSAIRNEPIMVQSLESNPYVIPLHKAARVGGKNAI